MANRRTLILLLAGCCVLVAGLIFNRREDRLIASVSPSAASVNRYDPPAVNNVTTKISGEKKDVKFKDAMTLAFECWEDLAKKAAAECPEQNCALKNLRRAESWAADWLEDGWDPIQENYGELESRKNKAIRYRYKLKFHQSTPVGQTMLALGQIGMLDGRKVKYNPQKAMTALSHLAYEDPTNSMPYLYMAAHYLKVGNRKAAEMYTMLATREGMRFDTYLNSLHRELLRHNYGSATTLIGATGIWSQTPVPVYKPIEELLVEFPEYAESVATQMLRDVRSREPVNDLNWNILEHVSGYKILKNAGIDTSDHRHPRDLMNEMAESWLPYEGDCELYYQKWAKFYRDELGR